MCYLNDESPGTQDFATTSGKKSAATTNKPPEGTGPSLSCGSIPGLKLDRKKFKTLTQRYGVYPEKSVHPEPTYDLAFGNPKKQSKIHSTTTTPPNPKAAATPKSTPESAYLTIRPIG